MFQNHFEGERYFDLSDDIRTVVVAVARVRISLIL